MLNEYSSLKHLTRSSFGDERLEAKGCFRSRNRFTSESCCQTSIHNWWALAVVVAFLTIGSICVLLLMLVRFEERNEQSMTNESDKSYLESSVNGKEKRTYSSDSINMLSPKTNLLSENYKESTMDLDRSARSKRNRRNTENSRSKVWVRLFAHRGGQRRFLALTDNQNVEAVLDEDVEQTIFRLIVWNTRNNSKNCSLEHINNPKKYNTGKWQEPIRTLTKCGRNIIKSCLELELHCCPQELTATPFFWLDREHGPGQKFSMRFELKGSSRHVHVRNANGAVELKSNSSRRTIFYIKLIEI